MHDLVCRCLASETECDKLRERANELRRKVDDTQAALLELGRENQSLQVTTRTVDHYMLMVMMYCVELCCLLSSSKASKHDEVGQNLAVNE